MIQASSPNEQPCSPNDTSEFTKSDKVVPFGELDQAQVERAKDSSKTSSKTSSKKGRKKRGYSHSSTHSQPPSQESFPEEEIVEFSEEEQAIYDFGKQTIFQAKPPKKTPYVRGQCAEIAKAGIKTLEQMKNLVALTKQEKGFKTLHLGNLINSLNSWLLAQQFATDPSLTQSPTAKAGTVRSSYDDDDYVDDTFYPTREVTHATC